MFPSGLLSDLKSIILSFHLQFYKCLLVLNSQWALFVLFPKARKALPELLSIVSAGTKGGNESDDTLAMACHTSNVLLVKDPEMGKHLLSPKLIASLNDISKNE